MKSSTWVAAAVASMGFGMVGMGCAHARNNATTDSGKLSVATKPAPAVDPTPSTVQQANDLEAVLRGTTLHFDLDQDNLTAESQQRLQNLSEVLHNHPSASIRISGNCDERGTTEYNLALGQQRAEVAKKYLVSLGVEKARIDTVSFGEEKPADPGHNEEAWSKNRRDEFSSRTRN